MLSCRSYWGLVWRRIRADGFDWGRDQVLLGLIIALIATVIQWRDGDFSGKSLIFTIVHASIPYAVLGLVYLLSLAVRGPWKLHKELSTALDDSETSRRSLEQTSGPNLLIEIAGKRGASAIIRIVNDGTESAVNAEFEESSDSRIKVNATPWVTPFVRPGASQEVEALFYEQINESGTDSKPLAAFLAGGSETLMLALRFENASGATFRRWFKLQRPLLDEHVRCYPEPREYIPPKEVGR